MYDQRIEEILRKRVFEFDSGEYYVDHNPKSAMYVTVKSQHSTAEDNKIFVNRRNSRIRLLNGIVGAEVLDPRANSKPTRIMYTGKDNAFMNEDLMNEDIENEGISNFSHNNSSFSHIPIEKLGNRFRFLFPHKFVLCTPMNTETLIQQCELVKKLVSTSGGCFSEKIDKNVHFVLTTYQEWEGKQNPILNEALALQIPIIHAASIQASWQNKQSLLEFLSMPEAKYFIIDSYRPCRKRKREGSFYQEYTIDKSVNNLDTRIIHDGVQVIFNLHDIETMLQFISDGTFKGTWSCLLHRIKRHGAEVDPKTTPGHLRFLWKVLGNKAHFIWHSNINLAGINASIKSDMTSSTGISNRIEKQSNKPSQPYQSNQSNQCNDNATFTMRKDSERDYFENHGTPFEQQAKMNAIRRTHTKSSIIQTSSMLLGKYNIKDMANSVQSDQRKHDENLSRDEIARILTIMEKCRNVFSTPGFLISSRSWLEEMKNSTDIEVALHFMKKEVLELRNPNDELPWLLELSKKMKKMSARNPHLVNFASLALRDRFMANHLRFLREKISYLLLLPYLQRFDFNEQNDKKFDAIRQRLISCIAERIRAIQL